VLTALGLSGCQDTTTAPPRDVTPPAAPRGLFSVTGDRQVSLHWLPNTEGDLSGYRIYQAPCESGTDCPYDRVGSTSATDFVLAGLPNGVTRFYAVAAVDRAGNESPLSPETVFDTPRPAGVATLNNFVGTPDTTGWDFSAFNTQSNASRDIFFGDNGAISIMFAQDFATDIQDAGFATSPDAVDFSPGQGEGWSPTGSVELILHHNYIVHTRDDHYAKFWVTSLTSSQVGFTWGYQTATGNPELRARPAARPGSGTARPIVWLRH